MFGYQLKKNQLESDKTFEKVNRRARSVRPAKPAWYSPVSDARSAVHSLRVFGPPFTSRCSRSYLNHFISPDPIIPDPADPQSWNRYAYVKNNPLKYVDPSGHQGCAANNQACWDSRWYRAHGYQQDSGGNWQLGGDAQFDDFEILTDVLAENGISLRGGDTWHSRDLSLVGQGAVALSNKVGGPDKLNSLLGANTVTIGRDHISKGWCGSNTGCQFASNITFYDPLFQSSDEDFIRGLAVHELAHVIDFASVGVYGSTYLGSPARVDTGTYSTTFPQTRILSEYAKDTSTFQKWLLQDQENFAEAVAIGVYGARYNTDGRKDLLPEQIYYLKTNLVSFP